MEHKGDCDTNCKWSTWNNPPKLDKGTGRLGNKRISGDHPDYSIIKIDKNTERSSRDVRRLAMTQTLVRSQLMTLEGKSLKRVK